ncbi:MAG TPA: apolipoprotein N-acyltransferase, partial [Caldimonas sp.]|nr:apolipoprotein N-acyltransferase [Caldimonas sp.]
QIQSARGELVVGPETVIPVMPDDLDEAWWHGLLERFRVPGRAAILGIPLGDAVHGYTNSAIGISAEASVLPEGFYRYDKHHLVPFGEFVPNGFHWFTAMMNIPLGDFERGPLAAPSFDVGGERVAPNICYEDLFGEELAARFVPEAGAPTILANISNIGWFGRTIAVEQHLRISRMRTLELQRPMIRATNTGATVVIDHRGTVTHSLPPFTVGILEGSVEGRQGLTPFAIWAGHLGLWPLALAAVALLFVLRRPRDA